MTIATISSEAESIVQMPEYMEFSSILSEMFSADHQPLVKEDNDPIVKSSCCNNCGGVVEKPKSSTTTMATVSSSSTTKCSEGTAMTRMVSDYSLVSDESDTDETSSQKVHPQSPVVSLNSSMTQIRKAENERATRSTMTEARIVASVPTSSVGSKKRTASEADLTTICVEGESTQKVQRR